MAFNGVSNNAGSEQAGVDPVKMLANRGITLKELLVAYHTATSKNSVNENCSTATFWNKFLKPLIDTSQCSYSEYLEKQTGQPRKPAEIHVVHSWQMEHRETLLAVSKAIHEINGGSLEQSSTKDFLNIDWHEKHQAKNLSTSVFLCTYVVDQYSIENHPVGTPGCQIDKFHEVAQEIYGHYGKPMVVALDENSTAMSRSLCLEEIHTAIMHRMDLKFSGTGAISMGEVDATAAKAYTEETRKQIFDRISGMDGGFHEFNRVVNCKVRGVVATARRQAKLSIGRNLVSQVMDNYVFIGNPGTGKSTLLNALTQQLLFKAGVSPDSGLTQILQKEIYRGNMYMDTPGLADRKMVEKASKEITESLKQGGNYHVFFFALLDAGRVRPADVWMIQAVLQSAPITQYSVIINKVEKKSMKHLADPAFKEKIEAGLMAGEPPEGLPVVTDRFLYIAREETLADEDDILLSEEQLPPGLKKFIHDEPGMPIQKEEVKPIQISDMTAQLEAQATLLKSMENDIGALKAQLALQKSKMVVHPKFKTIMCWFIEEEDICPYGDQCHFAHSRDELRPRFC